MFGTNAEKLVLCYSAERQREKCSYVATKARKEIVNQQTWMWTMRPEGHSAFWGVTLNVNMTLSAWNLQGTPLSALKKQELGVVRQWEEACTCENIISAACLIPDWRSRLTLPSFIYLHTSPCCTGVVPVTSRHALQSIMWPARGGGSTVPLYKQYAL